MAEEVHEDRRHAGDRTASIVVAALAILIASTVLALKVPVVGLPMLLCVIGGVWLLLQRASRRERETTERELERLRAIALPEGDAWRRLCAAEGLGAYVHRIAPRVRPAVRLETRPADALAMGASRIGGDPDLPPELPWPTRRGRPLTFLAQIDLAELERTLPGCELPSDGHLWIFVAFDELFSIRSAGDQSGVVVHRPGALPLERRAQPEGTPFAACATAMHAYEDPGELDDALFDELDETTAESYDGLRAYIASGGTDASHKILGHADPVQSAMEDDLEPTIGPWRLLLQLDSDDHAKMMWGDLGRLYVWIPEADLRAGRFEGARTIVQCH